ncbi:MAG: winged helix-turn-helix transcriptional regulator [Geodermatophilaceae bacterium]|nr:winged helix-turn-helix transcriptional regulator [Geodermatophilaceae bacterium]
MDDDPLRRPIGWWLKHVDGLLDLGFEATLGAQGVSRRQWQILNGLAEGTPAEELLESLTVFGDEDGVDDGVHDALAGLVLRGWLRTGPDGDALEITDAGRTEQERISAEVLTLRKSVTEGMSADDYRAVVTGLARMAENLDQMIVSAGGAAKPNPGRS